MRTRPRFLLVAATLGLLGPLAIDDSTSAASAIASPPPPPPAGQLGGRGPCGRAEQVLTTPGGNALKVFIETPTGGGSTPLVGGRCADRKRPVIFFSHGFAVGTPDRYRALIDHWVSVGNVVVMADYDSAADLPTTFRQVDDGNVLAVAAEPRIDTSRTGFYGYSHGGGMTPYLAQRADSRGWGRGGLWLTSLSQAYTQMQGTSGPIRLPGHARAMVVAGDHDQYADARNGIDVFESITTSDVRKAHITLRSDFRGLTLLDASHTIVVDGSVGSTVDAMDFALWRLSDILESCSLRGRNCAADLSAMGKWSDGVPVRPATVTDDPVDVGPFPVILAECDGTPIALMNNPRITECGPSRL